MNYFIIWTMKKLRMIMHLSYIPHLIQTKVKYFISYYSRELNKI